MAQSLYATPTPANTELNDGAVTVGVIWATNTAGTVTHIRFYAPPSFDGSYTVGLYNVDTNTQLATKAATGVTSGWNSIALTTPVSVSPGVTYIAAFHTSGGSYGFTSPYSWPVTSGDLYTASSNASRYVYGASIAQPTNTSGANYFADLVFEPEGGGAQTLVQAGFVNDQSFGSSSVLVGAVTLSQTGHVNDQVFGTSVVNPGPLTLVQTGFVNDQSFGDSTVTAGITLTQTGFTNDQTFGTNSVSPGPVTLVQTGHINQQTFGQSAVEGGFTVQKRKTVYVDPPERVTAERVRGVAYW